MKTIGLIGGMSWESTAVYYRLLNEGVKRRLGGLHSAPILLASVDFHEIEALQRAGRWSEAARLLGTEARRLNTAGADFLVLCTNTMHKVADQMMVGVKIPLLHVADVVRAALLRDGRRQPALLGTRFTMEQEFYRSRLESTGELLTLIPESETDRAEVHRVIYEELCLGRTLPASRESYRRILARLQTAGADSAILGCTEIALLVRPEDSPLPLYDSTHLHVEAALAAALSP